MQDLRHASRWGGADDFYFFHSDHLGSNSAMSDVGGALVPGSVARYTPFGDWRTEPTADLSDIGYTGHRHNNLDANDLGLIFMQARYCMPELGRFVSPDTLIPSPSAPQGFNRYAYTYNNPLKYRDQSGHCPWCIVIGAVVVIAKVVDYAWTGIDAWQSGATLADPAASDEDKLVAGLNVALSVVFEAIEPDDLLPAGIPADDIARRSIIAGFREAVNEQGLRAGVDILKDQLGSHAPKAIRHMYDQGLFRGIKSYGEWGKILSGVRRGAGLEVHHIVETRLAKVLGISNTGDMLSVVLTVEEHQAFTNAWRKWIPYGTDYLSLTKEQVWKYAQEVYAEHPELLEAARKTIFGE